MILARMWTLNHVMVRNPSARKRDGAQGHLTHIMTFLTVSTHNEIAFNTKISLTLKMIHMHHDRTLEISGLNSNTQLPCIVLKYGIPHLIGYSIVTEFSVEFIMLFST